MPAANAVSSETKRRVGPERPPLAWPEQFRSNAIDVGLKMYPTDIDAALRVAEKYANFVLGSKARAET